MSDTEGADDLASVDQLTNLDVPLGSEEPQSSASTPALAGLVNDANGDQPIAVEYAAIATDGGIPMEGIQQMVVVQHPEEAPQTLNGIDVSVLASIVQFCRNAGLKETENMLSKEVGFTVAGEEPDDQAALDFDEACQEFTKMINLLDSMFENIRAEFSTLLFPVFAHLYIKIINAGDSDFARQFMSKFSNHIPVAHFAQVDLLKYVTQPVQLQGCELIQNLLEHQYGVRLSKSCQKQLDTFLSKNPIIQEIIRDNIQIDQVDPQARNIPYMDFFNGGLLGHTPVDKKQKVLHGVTRDDIVVVGDKKKKKDLKDAKKKDSNAPPADRLPLPYVPEFVLDERRTAYREAVKKGRITADNPPSVCIYSACNTNGGLSSAEISENCSYYALGLNDGSVQVRALADDHIKKMKPSNKLDVSLNDEDIDIDIFEEFTAEEKPLKVLFTGHSGAVTSTCFSPDRRVLLTSSLDGTTRLWGIELRRNLVIYRHPAAVYQTKLSNRGLYFASSCADQSIHLWSTERINPIRVFTEPFGATHALDFHPNCNYVIGGSNDRNVRMWDVLTGTCVRNFTGHKSGIRGVKTSPDGRHVVSFSEDGALCVWDIGQQKLVAVQQCDPCSAKVPIQFSRDGSVFAVGTPHWGLSFFSLDSLITNDLNEPKVDPPGLLIHQYLTKRTTVMDLTFNRKNLVICIGALDQK